MATIYEVAALAGVSPATVSRALNGATVSEEKRRLVQKAAEQLDFRPNRAARRLRKQTSELIALLIPDIENPFFTALARGVEDRAQESGYSVVLCNTDDDPGKETRYLAIAASEDMAGVILAPSSEDGDLSGFVREGRPAVAVDRATRSDVDAVMVDNRAAAIAATNALFDAGYSRIACIAGPLGIEAIEERTFGWRQVMSRQNPRFAADAYLKRGNLRVDGGLAAARELLEMPDRPDAILTTNNLMGVGALQALHEAGTAPPEVGLAVIGELPFSTLASDTVTQVHLPARHIGTTAANMLIERISGDRQPPRTVVLRATVHPATGSAAAPLG